jgi:hypothetical protein
MYILEHQIEKNQINNLISHEYNTNKINKQSNREKKWVTQKNNTCIEVKIIHFIFLFILIFNF